MLLSAKELIRPGDGSNLRTNLELGWVHCEIYNTPKGPTHPAEN